MHFGLFYISFVVVFLGRVARAGRSGVAYSLVSPDEVSYVYDLHVFLGRPVKFVPQGKSTEGKYRIQ